MNKKKFITCELCGKNLIERLPNGIFRFMFGKDPTGGRVPVDIYIYGSIKMKCIKGTCEHWNTIHFFPPAFRELAKSELQSIDTNQSTKVEVLRERNEVDYNRKEVSA